MMQPAIPAFLGKLSVKEGERVSAGQVIALTGNTGHSTAPHLHYQLDRDNKTIDPKKNEGWVTEFVANLSLEMEATIKAKCGQFFKWSV